MLVLAPTEQSILDDETPLGHLTIDASGSLTVSSDAIRGCLVHVVHAVNSSHHKVRKLERDTEELNEALEVLRQQYSVMATRFSESEDSIREMRIQLSTATNEDESPKVVSPRPPSKEAPPSGGEDTDLRFEEFSARLGGLETSSAEASEKLGHQVHSMKQSLIELEEKINENLELRLSYLGTEQTESKVDIARLWEFVQDLKISVVTREEFGQAEKSLEQCVEGIDLGRLRWEEDRKSFSRLDECVKMSTEGTNRMNEVSQVIREQNMQIRDWVAKSFDEVKKSIQSLDAMDQTHYHHGEEIREELRSALRTMAEHAARHEVKIQKKAEASDLARLLEKLKHLNDHVKQPRQLLLSARRLTAHRDSAGGNTSGEDFDLNVDSPELDSLRHCVDSNAEEDIGRNGSPILSCTNRPIMPPKRACDQRIASKERQRPREAVPVIRLGPGEIRSRRSNRNTYVGMASTTHQTLKQALFDSVRPSTTSGFAPGVERVLIRQDVYPSDESQPLASDGDADIVVATQPGASGCVESVNS